MRKIYRVYVWLEFIGAYAKFKSQEFETWDEADDFLKSIEDLLPKMGAKVLSADIQGEEVPERLDFFLGSSKLINW